MSVKDADYLSRPSKGGSNPGRDLRDCPKALKLLAYRWAVIVIADGNTEYFRDSPVHGGRFTAKAFMDFVPFADKILPELSLPYWDDRRENKVHHKPNQQAAYLISQRFHKMLWGKNKDGTKGRGGRSNEHPDEWTVEEHIKASCIIESALAAYLGTTARWMSLDNLIKMALRK